MMQTVRMARLETRRGWLSSLTFVLALLMTGAPTAFAQEEVPPDGDVRPGAQPTREQTYETARGIGMGGGARASAVGTSAMAYNAANLSLAPVYHIETIVGYVPGQRTWMYGGSVADAVSSKMAMGLSFYGFNGNEDRDYSGYDARASLGMSLTERIGVGLSGRFIKLTSNQEDAEGNRVGTSIRAFTLDASIRLTIIEGLHVAALGYNLIRTHSPIAPLLVGGSVAYSYQQVFTLGIDAMADLTTFDDPEVLFGVGAEYLAGGSVPIRVGYRRDFGREMHQLTAALGYIDTKFGIDLGLRQDIGSTPRDTQLLLSIRYHVH